MEKTPFIGLTILEPDESIYADNSAFISRDRREIDRALHIGVKTHRHDGLPGLSNPAVAPSGLVIPSGGTIPAGISLTLGYTLEDAFGGETLISPSTLVTTPIPLDSPQTAPTAVLDTTAGTLDVDTFTYAVTWSDGEGGETPLGPSTTISRDPGFANARIKLSGLNVGMAEAGAVEWRLYRARSGGTYVLLTTGTGATFNDDGSVAAQCDVNPPTFNVNTTGSINQLQFSIPTGSAIGQATWINLYASQAGDFAESCLLAQVPVGSAGASLIFPSLELLDAQPPDVNRSYGGANKIDPDTELLEWPWLRPVAKFADLPAEAEHGDVRLVLETDTAYEFNKDGEWKPMAGGGGGGGSGNLKVIVPKVGGKPTLPMLEDVFTTRDPEWIEGYQEKPLDESEKFSLPSPEELRAETGSNTVARDDYKLVGDATGYAEFTPDEGSGFGECGVNLKAIAGGGFGTKYLTVSAHNIGGTMKLQVQVNEPELFTHAVTVAMAAGTKYRVEGELIGNNVVARLIEVETETLIEEFEVELPTENAEWAVGSSLSMGFSYVSLTQEWQLHKIHFGQEGEEGTGGNIEGVEALDFGDQFSVEEEPTGEINVRLKDGMGFVFAGEDLTKKRPDFECVTWMTTGSPGEPENMAEHDILIEL
jgi:hypothetical protein